MARRVLVTDHVFGDLETERAALEPLGAEVVLAPSSDEDGLIDLASTADAMLVCFASVGAPVVEAAADNGCAVIARYGIGVDNIDIETATRRGVRVTNVPDYCFDEVADHTLALLLALARQLPRASASVREGGWEIPHGDVHRIRDRRLALLGVGKIGTRVVERALSFGMKVVGYDPFLAAEVEGMERAESPEEAVREADFVSLHAPLTAETRNLVDAALIERMERAPVLVNTSRGGLVDLEAATEALAAGRLSGVGLDVTDPEPLPEDHPLRGAPGALVTPHMAFYSVESERELQERAAEEVVRAFNGEPARCPVNEAR